MDAQSALTMWSGEIPRGRRISGAAGCTQYPGGVAGVPPGWLWDGWGVPLERASGSLRGGNLLHAAFQHRAIQQTTRLVSKGDTCSRRAG